MKSVMLHGDGKTSESAMADALTSDVPSTRIMARGAASTWSHDMVVWLNDELNRPKANPTELMHALAVMQIQTFSSLAAQVMSRGGYEHAVALYKQLLDDVMLAHMERTHMLVAQAEGWA